MVGSFQCWTARHLCLEKGVPRISWAFKSCGGFLDLRFGSGLKDPGLLSELGLSPIQGRSDPIRSRLASWLAGLLDCTFQEAWQRPLAFQVFDDLEGRRDPKLAKAWFGSLAGLAHELEQRNQAGAGIHHHEGQAIETIITVSRL